MVGKTLTQFGMRGPKLKDRLDHFVGEPRYSPPALEKVGQKVGSILEAVPDDKPWFLYFGFNQSHRPRVNEHDGIDPAKLTLPPDWPDLPEVRLDYARYLSDVRELDTGVGLIMAALKKRQLDKNTIVILWVTVARHC